MPARFVALSSSRQTIASFIAAALLVQVAWGQEKRPKAVVIRPFGTAGVYQAEPLLAELPASASLTGRFPRKHSGDSPVVSLAFSGDNRFLLVGEDNSKYEAGGPISNGYYTTRKKLAFARLWDLTTGAEVRRMSTGNHMYVQSACLTGDGELAAGIGRSKSIGPFGEARNLLVWYATGEEMLNVPKTRGERGGPTHACLSADGRWLVAAGDAGPVLAWDLKNLRKHGNVPPNWSAAQSKSIAPVISRSRQSVFFVGKNGQSRIGLIQLSLQTGKQIAYHAQLLNNDFRFFSISPDEVLFAETYFTEIAVRDLHTGHEVRRLTSPGSIASSPVFNRTGKRLMAFLDDGKAIEWSIQSGDVTWQEDLGKGPKAVSPDGTLLASYRRLSDALGCIEIIHLPTARRVLALYPCDAEGLHFAEISDVAGAGPLNSNDPRAVEIAMRKYLAGPQAALGNMPANAGVSPRRLFVLAVGISKHKDREYDLKYAAADAEALVEFFKGSKSDLFQEVFVNAITDEQASVENISQSIDWIQNACSQNDVCVMMFSGHGLKGRKGLYFFCHEGNPDSLQTTCLNWSKIGEAIGAIKAKQTLILADCCHAGAFALERSPPQEALLDAIQNRQNVFVFCSSEGNQASLELESARQGAFMSAILTALRGAGDKNGDGQVALGEFHEFVSDEVRRITSGSQMPILPFPKQFDPSTVLVKTDESTQ